MHIETLTSGCSVRPFGGHSLPLKLGEATSESSAPSLQALSLAPPCSLLSSAKK